MSAPSTVILYARVSNTDEGSAHSVTDQMTELRAWAAREGWTVTHEYAEQGSASTYAKKARPEWDLVMKAVERRDADALLTWEASRATRDLTAYAALRDACAAAGMAWGYSGALHDLTERSARFRTGLEALLAEDEAAKTRDRVVRGVRAAAQRGTPHGRHLYGYRRIYEGEGDARRVSAVVEDPQRAPVVREAAQRVLAGQSLYAIARDLNGRSVPVAATDREERAGLLWTAPRIRQMLRRPGYAGLRTYHGEVVGDAAWEPLVEQDDWDELQRLLSDPARVSGRGEHRAQHLLSGIARCTVCGGKLVVRATRSGQRTRADGTRPATRRYRTYACTAGAAVPGGGFHVSMSADHLDTYVSGIIVGRLSRPDALASLGSADDGAADQRAALHEEIAGYRAHLEEARAYASEHLRMDLLIDQEARTQPKIAEAERKLRELAGVDPAVRQMAEERDVREAWEACGIEAQRHLVRELLVVSVRPRISAGRKGMDPRRVDVTWTA